MTRSPRWRALPFLFVMMTSAASAQILKGAGATFPHPLYQAWLAEYQKGSDTRISYDAVGSGEGIRRLKDYWVDFGASDKYLTTEEMRELPLPLLHVPTCLGAVVLIYNLPGNPPLRLTPAAISGIFLGEIKYWNDEIIQSTNPDAVLPATKIKAIQRSDGSGTTYIFTNYLSKVSAVWKKKIRQYIARAVAQRHGRALQRRRHSLCRKNIGQRWIRRTHLCARVAFARGRRRQSGGRFCRALHGQRRGSS